MARKQKKDPFLFFVVLLVLFLLFGLPLLKDQQSVTQIFKGDSPQGTVPLKPILTARSKSEKQNTGQASSISTALSKSEKTGSENTTKILQTSAKSQEIPPQETPAKFKDAILVAKVIDGDTIELSDGRRVRLIGIDTPESRKNEKAKRDSLRSKTDLDKIVQMGLKAKNVLNDLVANRMVNLEYDVAKKDKYGRTLAYVYLVQPSDEIAYLPLEKVYQDKSKQIFVNATMIQNGFAQPMTYPPNVKYVDLFKDLFEEARQANRGFWEEKEVLVKDKERILF